MELDLFFKFHPYDRCLYVGVEPKIGGKPPKWMVYFMENPMKKWMIWGENPLFLETSHIYICFRYTHQKKRGSTESGCWIAI